MSAADPPGKFVEVEGLRLHYIEQGSGDVVLMLHGWPTSAYLWRGFLGPLGERRRAVALDLPGFGHSDKPTDASYSFRFHERVISGFCDAIGAERIGLAVHDLGGPIGLYWASEHPERLSALALLNTLVYARPSLAVIAFVTAARLPLARSWLTSQVGLRWAMRFGVREPDALSDEVIAAYQAPFTGDQAREALRKSAISLHPGGFKQIERWLPRIDVPVRIVYGERDRILPDVARTMRRVERDVGGAEVTKLPDCGHFIQEERPDEIAEMLAEFFE